MGASTTMRVRVSFYVLCVYVYVRVHACPLARGRAPSRTLRRAIVHHIRRLASVLRALPQRRGAPSGPLLVLLHVLVFSFTKLSC